MIHLALTIASALFLLFIALMVWGIFLGLVRALGQMLCAIWRALVPPAQPKFDWDKYMREIRAGERERDYCMRDYDY